MTEEWFVSCGLVLPTFFLDTWRYSLEDFFLSSNVKRANETSYSALRLNNLRQNIITRVLFIIFKWSECVFCKPVYNIIS